MFTVCEPHTDEKVTAPLCFFTVMVKVTELLPVTLCEPGVTWICPLLLEVAAMVPEPLKSFR
jgi:hypothetical protein